MNFEVIDGILGKRFVLTGSWNEDLIHFFNENNCVEIELNSGKGWNGDSIDFVLRLANIRGLIIRSLNIAHCGKISELNHLELLELDSYCKGSIDFSLFNRLQECGFNWRNKASTIFEVSTLRDLYINKYPGLNLLDFHNLSSLTNLTLLGVSKLESLNGISALQNLKNLRIGFAQRLTDISDIRTVGLETLTLDYCKKIKDFSPLASIRSLRKLDLTDCGLIESLEWIGSLTDLEELYFPCDTNIVSGDLSILESLPKLRKIAFANRKHYTHETGFSLTFVKKCKKSKNR